MQAVDNRKWFILSQDRVLGPFEKETLETQARQHPGALIWGRGQNDWVSFEQWEKALLDFESTNTRTRLQVEREWHVRHNGQELKPMIYPQMIEFLKTVPDFKDVLIWTEGYAEWKEIYQIHKILDDLGVSRRRHPRVPVMGAVELETEDGILTARALSISEGGLGITDSPPVKIGDRFKLAIKSANLYGPVHATAEVVFVGSDGYSGLKFVGLPTESKGAIIEYVKKFTEGVTNTGTLTAFQKN